MAPSAIALSGLMNPAAGVIATSPTTIAVAAPTAVGLRDRAASRNVHTSSVAAGASIVVTNARAAIGLAASALPALNPNHPNHRSPAPSSVNGTLCGSSDDDGYACRLPTTIAATSAAIAALTCTTVPPAKSSAPNEMKRTYAEKRMRSTMAPEISAAVMMQNVA